MMAFNTNNGRQVLIPLQITDMPFTSTRPYRFFRPALLTPLLLTAACQTPIGQEWRPTIGASTTIVDSYEFGLDALGYLGYTESIDYSMTQVEIGATRIKPQEGRPTKYEFAGVSFGSGKLRDDSGSGDLTEISGGGYWYFDKGDPVIPFLSLWSTVSKLNDSILDPQLGLRVGGGFEYAIGNAGAITLGGDYLFPIVDAEDSTGLIQGRISGFAIRLGFRILL